MKIAIIVDKPNIFYTGLGFSYDNAFKYLGYESRVFNFNINLNLYRITRRIKCINDFHLLKEGKKIFNQIDEFKPDIVFIIKGYFLHPKIITDLKKSNYNPTIACFHPDDPFSENIGASNRYICEAISKYDHYFIWGERLKQVLNKHNQNTKYISFAADHTLIPDTKNEEIYNVAFVGNCDLERNRWMKELDNILYRDDININVFVFGGGWSKFKKINVCPPQFGVDYFQIFKSAKINLNILRKQNKGATNMRTFEIPASGGFMLHENSYEAKKYFREGIEAEYFSTADELIYKIKFYIENNSLRKKIAETGYKRSLEENQTYVGRAKRIIEIVK